MGPIGKNNNPKGVEWWESERKAPESPFIIGRYKSYWENTFEAVLLFMGGDSVKN